MLTQSATAGAAIVRARQRLATAGAQLQGVVIDDRIGDAGAGSSGVGDVDRVCDVAARSLGVASGDSLLSLSTGLSGRPLSVDAMVAAMPGLAASVTANAVDAALDVGLWCKVRRAALPGGASVVGFAKGAGMATIQFRSGRWRRQRPRSADETPDAVVTDVAELEAAIAALVT